jgi:hypothetical protein
VVAKIANAPNIGDLSLLRRCSDGRWDDCSYRELSGTNPANGPEGRVSV